MAFLGRATMSTGSNLADLSYHRLSMVILKLRRCKSTQQPFWRIPMLWRGSCWQTGSLPLLAIT